MLEGTEQHVLLPWTPHPDGIGHICDGDILSSHMGLIESKDNKSFPTGANGSRADPPNLPPPLQPQPFEQHYVTDAVYAINTMSALRCHRFRRIQCKPAFPSVSVTQLGVNV